MRPVLALQISYGELDRQCVPARVAGVQHGGIELTVVVSTLRVYAERLITNRDVSHSHVARNALGAAEAHFVNEPARVGAAVGVVLLGDLVIVCVHLDTPED